MEIILKDDIYGLGKTLDVVKVKDGYANNYLFPRGLAILATDRNKALIEAERAKLAEVQAKEKGVAEQLANKLATVSLTIAARVSEDEKIYGSIQQHDIADKLKEAGYDIDKKKVILPEAIKQLGMFSVKLQLHREVEAKIKLWVINDESK